VTCEVNVWPSLFVPLGAVDAERVAAWAKLPIEQFVLVGDDPE
jgi:hypothetical protein